jgi:uncharacterized membrane protein
MNMNRLAVCVALLLSSGAAANARPKFLPILKSTFNIPAGSDADKAGCNVCHAGPPVRNIFGKAVEKALDKAGVDDVTPAILMTLDKLDSDGDGYTNGEELRAGYLPGDPNNHPSKHESAGSKSPSSTSGNPLDSLIPKHTFHPAIVHFPIALYVFGVILEIVGIRKRDGKFRDAAFWNFVGAAFSLAVVIPTGLISSFRQGFSLTPGQPVFTHFLCAVSASIGIISTAVWLKKSRPTSAGYWLLLAVTFALVCAAGFFGGELVY